MKIINAISILDEILTTGHSPLKILGDDGNIYITKVRKHTNLDTEIISEFLCNYLCGKWGIMTPECAVIKVATELIIENKTLSKRHKPILYKDYPCFGSKFLNNVSEVEIFDLSPQKYNHKLYYEISQFLKIGLFDLWVVNIDRKPTNLNLLKSIRLNKTYDFIAVDHAYSFDTLLYNQLTLDIELSYNESILSLDFAKVIYNTLNSVSFEKEFQLYFEDSIRACSIDIQYFIQELQDTLQLRKELFQSLLGFLFNEERNGTIFADFLTRVK